MKQRKRNHCFTEEELKVINKLSDVAKQRFWSLDLIDQKRMLRKAKLLKEENQFKIKSKNEVRKKAAKSKSYMGSKKAQQGVELYAQTLNDLLAESISIEQNESQESSNRVSLPPKTSGGSVRDALLHNGMTKRDLRKWYAIKKKQQKMAAEVRKGTHRTTKAAKVTSNGLKKILIATARVIRKLLTSPIALGIFLVIVVISIIVSITALLLSTGGGSNGIDDSTYQSQVSEKTESYRALVEKYCGQYEIEDYVDLCLAVMEQESGGNGTDVMQAEQSYYNVQPPIDTPEESIDCGVHELSDCLKNSKAKNSGDIPLISLALQGYNFGNGYIAWAKKNYGGYSLENAKIFSQKMCISLGVDGYGDVEYVPHVLRYYVPNGDTKVTNKQAAALIKELKENNKADQAVWKVIEKGASLTGNVTYGMLDPPRQDDGRDHPSVLDCSSFAAWSFHKSGYTGVPYASTTKTFIDAKNFVTVNAKDLQVGDIGLKSATAPTGGANHVGIYCGKLKNGTKVWLHCTSSSGSSLTGNSTGVMMGAYTNFTFFRRLSKWNKEDS